MVATLFLVDEYEIDVIRESKSNRFDYEADLYVDEYWEPIMYILSDGQLGKDPYVTIFMPKNPINIAADNNPHGPFVRYHEEIDIAVIEAAISTLNEATIRNRINLEAMNQKVMKKVTEDRIDELVDNTLKVIKFFQKAKAEQLLMIAAVG